MCGMGQDLSFLRIVRGDVARFFAEKPVASVEILSARLAGLSILYTVLVLRTKAVGNGNMFCA